jgi:hypothetical protein
MDTKQYNALKSELTSLNKKSDVFNKTLGDLLLSDDETLNELQEVVNFIKQNKSILDSLGISNISGLVDALNGKEPANTNIQSHISSNNNPHGITKAQVGLSSCDNTTDLNKPISNAMQSALNGKADVNHTHVGNEDIINADKEQRINYEQTPTSQSIAIQLNGNDADQVMLKIHKTVWMNYAIPTDGCSVGAENPLELSGSIAALNANLAQITVLITNNAFNEPREAPIKFEVVGIEEKEIVVKPVYRYYQ